MAAIRIPLSYIVRNLGARKLTTVLTAGGMALVVDVFATVEYGRDLAGLHRDNNLRQERLIDSALKMPGLPGVLRRALLDVKQNLLNYDALND